MLRPTSIGNISKGMTNTNTTVNTLAARWWAGAFKVERRCDCKKGHRGGECFTSGWHCVASDDDARAAVAEAASLTIDTGVKHRAVDARTGREVSL